MFLVWAAAAAAAAAAVLFDSYQHGLLVLFSPLCHLLTMTFKVNLSHRASMRTRSPFFFFPIAQVIPGIVVSLSCLWVVLFLTVVLLLIVGDQEEQDVWYEEGQGCRRCAGDGLLRDINNLIH